MFKIGDFAKFSRVSVRMLRHYDQLSLLKPARVDPYTDYRYYSADQLPRLNRILALKELGFRLEQIGDLLDRDVSPEELRGMLELRRAELQTQLDEDQARLAQIESRIQQVESGQAPPAHEVVLRQVEALTVAAIACGPADPVEDAFEELEAYVAEQSARAEGPPLAVFDEAAEEGGALVAVPVRGAWQPGGRVISVELPAVETMACVVYHGSYAGIHAAGQALLTWIGANGFRINGPSREVYLRFGAQQQDYLLPDAYLAQEAGDFVTELQIPVEREQGDDYGALFSHRQTGSRPASGAAHPAG